MTDTQRQTDTVTGHSFVAFDVDSREMHCMATACSDARPPAWAN